MNLLTPDTILQNRYRIVQLIGQGGMGAVYEAVDLRLRSRVALKQMMVGGEQLSQAFEREAQLLANLRHPTLPRVMDHLTDPVGQFLAMEFFPGPDLAQMLAQRGAPFPVDQVLVWFDLLLGTLHYLHSRQPPIIHRDIKPQNMKLLSPEEVILLDFGLAKGFAQDMSRITTGGSIIGYTPQFAPLEQIQGQGTDPRSDLYSLAATIHCFLVGSPPADALARATAMVTTRPDPLRPAHISNPAVPLAISDLLTNALALNIDLRPASANEMRQVLAQARQGRTSATDPTTWVGPVIVPINSGPRPASSEPATASRDVTEIEPTATASRDATEIEPAVVVRQDATEIEPAAVDSSPSVQQITVLPAQTVDPPVSIPVPPLTTDPVAVPSITNPTPPATEIHTREPVPVAPATAVLDVPRHTPPAQVAVTPALPGGNRTGRRNLWLGLGALLVLVLGGGGFLLLRPNNQQAAVLPPATATVAVAVVATDTAPGNASAEPATALPEEPTSAPEPSPTPEATSTPEATPTVVALSVEEIAYAMQPSTVLLNVAFAETALDGASEGGGTGIVYDTAQGYIVTNAHVVEGAAALEVVLPNTSSGRAARVVGRSQCDDLAVLKINDTTGLQAARFSASSTAPVGSEVVALGFPETMDDGTSLTTLNGTIAQLDASYEGYEGLIQTNIDINAGNSGGPLVNRQGEVIGINTDTAFAGGERPDGANYAIALEYAHPIIEELAAGNNVLYTGLNLSVNQYEEYYGTAEGLVVVGVASGSPAALLKVQPADLLYKLEGRPVNTVQDVCQILRSHADGDQIKVELLRGTMSDGEYLAGELTIGNPAAGYTAPELVVIGPAQTAEPTPEEPSGSGNYEFQPLFETDFSYVDDNFSTVDTENSYVAIEDGVYLAELKTPQRYLWLPVAGTEELTDSYIETDVTLDGDEQSYAGLILRQTEVYDKPNLYTCMINNGGAYLCALVRDGEGTTLVEGTSDAILPDEVNILAFGVVGNQFQFRVNEQDVALFADDTYTEGAVGFSLQNFDNPFTATYGHASGGTINP